MIRMLLKARLIASSAMHLRLRRREKSKCQGRPPGADAYQVRVGDQPQTANALQRRFAPGTDGGARTSHKNRSKRPAPGSEDTELGVLMEPEAAPNLCVSSMRASGPP